MYMQKNKNLSLSHLSVTVTRGSRKSASRGKAWFWIMAWEVSAHTLASVVSGLEVREEVHDETELLTS